MRKNTILSMIAISLILSLTGCSTLREGAVTYPLVPALTESEVMDFYLKSMSFDAIVKKNIEVDKTNYEMRDVTSDTKVSQLKSALSNTEKALTYYEYDESVIDSTVISENTFGYIKAYLNDRALSNSNIISIKQALGYYFVDVEYDISPSAVGSFTNLTSLMGLNGAFVHDTYYDTDSIDSSYMTQAVNKLNKYYEENGILDKRASFDRGSTIFSTNPEDANGDVIPPLAYDDTENDNDNNEENRVPLLDDEGNQVLDDEGNPVYEDNTNDENSSTDNNNTSASTVTSSSGRTCTINVEEFNRVVGSSTKMTAYMPKLDMVYNIPSASNNISGLGIFPSGIGGLSKFGFDRKQLTGKLTLRFVYKDDLDNPNVLVNTNIYPIFSEITSGFSANTDNIIPEFLMTEFEKLIDRADRAIVNNDMSALISGKIYSDMGIAVLRGYENNHVNVMRQLSTIRRVIGRDIANNAYLLEVESQRQEGPKGANVYGTYRDKSYVVIEQVGQQFVITDTITMTRQMQTEPDINPDSAVAKRLVALNLAGEVSDNMKLAAQNVINNLYKASTYRVLNGPKNVKSGDSEITIEKGMYDCFNNDPEMLSSTEKENMNSRLRAMLVKHGTNVAAEHFGVITEWIGGAEKQVEFTTEELIVYKGMNTGVYMKCYYLISCMADEWVIDDLQIVESEDKNGSDLESEIDRLKN